MDQFKKLLKKKKKKKTKWKGLSPPLCLSAKAFAYLISYSQDLSEVDATVIPI